MTVSEDFASLTGRFRGELLAHCYRMLGSAEEAEDLVQETYLRAWRSFDGFEGRSSVRTWLYRIATNVCLTAIERRGRRPLPSGLGGPAEDPQAQLVTAPEVPWLQPFPDALLAGEGEDPAAAAVSRTGIRLAFVAALQHLSARERAVLILRDVLEFPAAEAADLLGTTATAVNSGLRRARAQLALAQPVEDELAEPADPARRALLDRFAAAFETADANALAELLREDVALEMPPLLTWFAGRPAVARFMASRVFARFGGFRMVSVMANGQPAFAAYTRGDDGSYHAHEVLVPTLSETGIARIVVFLNPDLFEMFGLPHDYEPPGQPGSLRWQPRSSVVALLAVEKLADGVHVADVPGGLLDHVQHHPAQGDLGRPVLRELAHLIQRIRHDDLVRRHARATPELLFCGDFKVFWPLMMPFTSSVSGRYARSGGLD